MLQITPETETPADTEEKTDDALYCAGCGHLVTRGRWKILMGGSERHPFLGLHVRIKELLEHHEQRLDRLLGVCAEPATVLETLPHLFKRELNPFSTLMATGESLAHLNYLLGQGRMVREHGSDGVHRYRRTAAAVDAA